MATSTKKASSLKMTYVTGTDGIKEITNVKQ